MSCDAVVIGAFRVKSEFTHIHLLIHTWWKYVCEVLVNRLGGLSLPRKSMVRLAGSPDMTIAVFHGCNTTTQ